MNDERAERGRRLLSWHRWLLIVLGVGFVLFFVALTILLLVFPTR